MRINIDIDKSIKCGRLKTVPKNFSQKLDAFINLFGWTFIIVIGLVFPIYMTAQGIVEDREEIIAPLIVFSPFVFIGLLSLHTLINDNRLKKIEGVNELENHKHITAILEKRFKTTINKQPAKTARMYKKATCWKWGTRVIVIFDGKNILINISRFNLKGLKSPFHPWFDSFKINSINKEFQKKIILEDLL